MESRVIEELYQIIKDRKTKPVEGSYTCHLFNKGRDLILKKVSEEATEVILASKSMDREETISELADLCYHILVMMCHDGITPSDVCRELQGRMKNNNKGG